MSGDCKKKQTNLTQNQDANKSDAKLGSCRKSLVFVDESDTKLGNY